MPILPRLTEPPSIFHWRKVAQCLTTLSDRFESSRITLEEITADPSKHLIIFRPSMLDSNSEGILPSEITCLYSSWAGYLEKPDWKNAIEKIQEAEGKLVEGHILSTDIARFVKSISPTTIITVHTFEPEQFQQHFENIKLISDGESWMVE